MSNCDIEICKTHIIHANTLFYSFYARHSFDLFIAVKSQIIIVKLKHYFENDRPILSKGTFDTKSTCTSVV